METEKFRKNIDGKETGLYKLTNKAGTEVHICNLGAAIVSFKIKDAKNILTDVLLGHDSVSGYLTGNPYFGAVCGRFANRIGYSSFVINGEKIILNPNMGPHQLHGGKNGFSMKVWSLISVSENSISMSLDSPHGDEGYPGNLYTTASYKLTDDNSLIIEFEAITDKVTIVNLTSHPFFNLMGEGTDNFTDHLFQINASNFLPVNEDLVTTGEIAPVAGTPFDLRKPTSIDFSKISSNNQLTLGRGFDHCYVPDTENNPEKIAAQVSAPNGIILSVYTNQPGLQFYTGNWLDGTDKGKSGKAYNLRSGFCLEAQNFPDSPNKPNFPDSLLKPGEKYYHKTIYSFSVKNIMP